MIELALCWVKKTKLYKELLEINTKIHDIIVELGTKDLPKDFNSDLELYTQRSIDPYYTRAHTCWDLRNKLDGFSIDFTDIDYPIPVVVTQGDRNWCHNEKYYYRVGKRKLAPLLRRYEDIMIDIEKNYNIFREALELYSGELTYSDVKQALNLKKLDEDDTD